jgi:hypothetical protein
MRKGLLAALVVMAGSTAACGNETAATPPAAHTTAPPSVTPSAAPTEQTLLRGMVSEEQLASMNCEYSKRPLAYIASESAKFSLISTCGSPQPSDAKSVLAEQSSGYDKSDYRFEQSLSYYGSTSGTEAVADVKKSARCATEDPDDAGMTYAGEVAMPAITGIDAQFAFCSQSDIIKVQECHAVLARGSFATSVSVDGEPMGGRTASTELTKLAALAGASLLKI